MQILMWYRARTFFSVVDSVVDPNTLNFDHDLDPGFWPNLDPDLDPGPDPDPG